MPSSRWALRRACPKSVQIIGPRYHEWACLDAADVVEAALGIVTPIDPME